MSDIALRSDVPPALDQQMELARTLAVSGLLPQHLQRKPENILAIMYAARSIDVPLWQAMQSMQVINGKVGLSADLMRALILRAGHTFRVTESTDERATVEIVRKGDEFVHVSTFTMDDARTAGLASGPTWGKYPRAMLVARATTLGARQSCADVLAGMSYTVEELGAEVDEDGRIVVDVQPVEGQPRPLDELPRNVDGSVSRSRTSDEEKAAAGLMTAEQQKEHTALLPKREPGRVERTDTAADDAWVLDGPVFADPADVARLNATFTGLGITGRVDKLRVTSASAGRPITTTKDLTRDECAALMKQLESGEWKQLDPALAQLVGAS